MAIILDGKALSEKIRSDLKLQVDSLKEKGIIPKLAVIMVGDDSASKIYVRNKSKACEKVGIEFEEYLYDSSLKEEELLDLIKKLNNDPSVHGILLQSPVPKHINIQKAFQTISPEKDVDGFNAYNVGKLAIGEETFISCTPFGIMKFFEEYNINIEGKHAVILGRSNIVGKPMIQCMLNKNATVTVCHSKTKNLSEITKKADIIICAIGKPKFLKADMVKDEVIVIDVGINRDENGKICGDTDFEELSKKASYITPVPGGVGPMTITMLLNNVVKAAQK